MESRIEKISDSHWPEALKLLEEIYVGEGYTLSHNAAPLFTRKKIESGGQVYVASINSKVIGVILLVYENGHLVQVSMAGEREIRLLGVHKDYRKEKLGEKLMQVCIDQSHGSSRVVLCTQTTMIVAQKLYDKMGFVRDPSRDFKTSEGVPRLFYFKNLI